MPDIDSQCAKFLVTLIVGLMVAWNSADAFRDIKESRYFKFGIDIAFIIYWILLMTRLVLN